MPAAPETLVLDASVAAAWILPDEADDACEAVLDLLATVTAEVPDLFWHELRNILVTAERRGRLDTDGAGRALAQLRRLSIRVAADPGDAAVLGCARAHALTGYDAAYLALAERRGAMLATRDADLARAAGRVGLAVTPAPS